MPPIKRRSNITAKFSKIRGLEPEEKRIFTRIGELVDAVINNRAPTNPFSKDRRIITRTDPSLPPPTGLTVQNGIRSAKLMWNPVTSNFLQFYEVKITEAANGDETTGIAYTNNFTIKDKTGTFKADVRSVGRDGTASTFTSIDFDIQPNVILYNGEKNLTDQLGFVQITPIYCPKGYNVFLWSSMVLDSFSDPNFNLPTEIALSVENSFYSGGDYYLFNNFIQTVQGFREEVTFTNLSVAGGGGSTSRPGGSPTRTATFQTTKATSYSPYAIPDILGDRTNIFFVAERHRDDVVGLALNAWVCTAGTAVVTGVAETRGSILWSAYGQELKKVATTVQVGVSWTVGFWIKFLPTTDPAGSRVWDMAAAFNTIASGTWTMKITKSEPLNNVTADIGTNAGGGRTLQVAMAAGAISLSSWAFVVITYNNSTKTLQCYINGSFQTSGVSLGFPTPAIPLTGATLWSESRPDLDAKAVEHYYTSVWDGVLPAADIAYLYSVGASRWNNFDLTSNEGTYVSASSLAHWWKPGIGTIGQDYKGGITLDPTGAGNPLTDADKITDVPGTGPL